MDYIYWKKLVHFHFSNLVVIVGPFREKNQENRKMEFK